MLGSACRWFESLEWEQERVSFRNSFLVLYSSLHPPVSASTCLESALYSRNVQVSHPHFIPSCPRWSHFSPPSGTTRLLVVKAEEPIKLANLLTKPAHSIINQASDSRLRLDAGSVLLSFSISQFRSTLTWFGVVQVDQRGWIRSRVVWSRWSNSGSLYLSYGQNSRFRSRWIRSDCDSTVQVLSRQPGVISTYID